MGNFDWTIIIGPLVGAVIGYCTNFIAVKMLFRPLNEKKIFGMRVPFTPGIIPKEKPRLAKAIGDAVGGSLLNEETLSQHLLTDDMRNKIRYEANDFVDKLCDDDQTIKEKLEIITSKNDVEKNMNHFKDALSDKICNKMTEMHIGQMISHQVIIAVKSKLEGNFIMNMLGDGFLDSLAQPISEMIDNYIKNNGQTIITEKISEEVDNFIGKPTGELVNYLLVSQINYGDVAVKAYETFVKNRLSHVLETVNLGQIIEDKINKMDVLELEELLLFVMKKELNAIVNLGALIGFILGIVMIFI